MFWLRCPSFLRLSTPWKTRALKTYTHSYRGFQYASEISSQAVWLYHRFRFRFSFREVVKLPAEPGSMVTYETIRQWCQRSGLHILLSVKTVVGEMVDGKFVLTAREKVEA